MNTPPSHVLISQSVLHVPTTQARLGEAFLWAEIFRENSDFSLDRLRGERHLEEQCTLCGWTSVSGSQEHSRGSLTRASKRQHQRSDLKCEKESIIILQNEAFSNMANVTGSWQHYFGFLLSERVPPQRRDKKPWDAILWNGKMTERQPRGIQT